MIQNNMKSSRFLCLLRYTDEICIMLLLQPIQIETLNKNFRPLKLSVCDEIARVLNGDSAEMGYRIQLYPTQEVRCYYSPLCDLFNYLEDHRIL